MYLCLYVSLYGFLKMYARIISTELRPNIIFIISQKDDFVLFYLIQVNNYLLMSILLIAVTFTTYFFLPKI